MQLNFDASNVAPDAGRDTVPADWYDVQVSASEIVPTKDGSGKRLRIQARILSGNFAGRILFHAFNIVNNSAEAVRISMAQLSALAHAVGVLQVQDSEQLHGIPLKVKVKIRKGNDDYPDDQNEITVFKPASDPQPTNMNANAPRVGGMPSGAAPSWAPAAGAPQGFAPAQAAQPQQFAQQAPQAQPAQSWQAPAGQQAWANGAPQQPQAHPAQAAQHAPAVADHPAVAAAQQAQPAFVQQPVQQPVQQVAPQQAAPLQQPQVAAQPVQQAAPAQSWQQAAAPGQTGNAPSWAS
jgi:Protein of unknown function (DUF669)